MKDSSWNSLEVAKLLMAATVPITIFAAGSFISQQSSRQIFIHDEAMRNQDNAFKRHERIDEKRVALWDKIAPDIQEIRAFNNTVSLIQNSKKISWIPRIKGIHSIMEDVDVKSAKNSDVNIINTIEPNFVYFSSDFVNSYSRFHHLMWAEFVEIGNGKDEDDIRAMKATTSDADAATKDLIRAARKDMELE